MIVLRTGASDGCSLIRLIPVGIKKAIFLDISGIHEIVYTNIIIQYMYNNIAVVVIKTKHKTLYGR